jgi:hypothetical protein
VLPSMMATHELVVPRSMPMILPMMSCAPVEGWYVYAVAADLLRFKPAAWGMPELRVKTVR